VELGVISTDPDGMDMHH